MMFSLKYTRSKSKHYHISFKDYDRGDCPVRVENFCDDVFIKIHEK